MAACTKKKQPDTLFSNMLGQWRKTAYATDDNNNGIIDPQEIHAQSSTIVDELVFNGDATGYEKTIINNLQPEAPLAYKWDVSTDSMEIVYDAHYSILYYVAVINSKNLTLYTNTSNGLAAYYYGK